MLGSAALHCGKYFLGLEEAETQTTDAERRLLAKYAARSKRGLEIGVFEGVTTRILAESMPDAAELFAVDPFFRGRLGVCWSRLIARAEVSKAQKIVHFVESLSKHAANRIDSDFDFIFVDGDHSLEGISTDWQVWSSRCVINGIIALHDTRDAPHAPQVREFGSFAFYWQVIRNDSRYEEIDSADTLSVVKRVR